MYSGAITLFIVRENSQERPPFDRDTKASFVEVGNEPRIMALSM